MKVLLICDDYYHPGQIPIDGIYPLKEKGFQFDIITNANDFSPEMLHNYPVVLLIKCDHVSQTDNNPWKSEAVQKAFVEYVENGGGLVAVHNAAVSGDNTKILDELIGCRSVSHPEICPVTVKPIKIHPVTEGVELFCEIDEHYIIDILVQDVNILLESCSKNLEAATNTEPLGSCTAGYVRTQGTGRVCVLTPGHTVEVWRNAQFLRLMENALNWCGGRE